MPDSRKREADAVKLAAAVAASRPTINAVSVLRGITVPAAIEPLTARPDSASNDNEERSKRAAAALGADVPGTPQPSRPAAKDVRVNSPKTSFAGPLPLSLERNDTGTSADVVAYRFPPAPQPLNRLRDRPRYQGAGFSFAVPPTPLQPSTVTLDGKLVGHFAATRQPTPFTRTGSRAGATIAMRLTLSNAPPLPLSKAADTGGAHVDAVKRMRTMFAPVMPVSLQTTSRTTVSDLAGLFANAHQPKLLTTMDRWTDAAGVYRLGPSNPLPLPLSKATDTIDTQVNALGRLRAMFGIAAPKPLIARADEAYSGARDVLAQMSRIVSRRSPRL